MGVFRIGGFLAVVEGFTAGVVVVGLLEVGGEVVVTGADGDGVAEAVKGAGKTGAAGTIEAAPHAVVVKPTASMTTQDHNFIGTATSTCSTTGRTTVAWCGSAVTAIERRRQNAIKSPFTCVNVASVLGLTGSASSGDR